MTVDFFILGLIYLELSWCALRLRSWTSLAGYRLNRAQVPYFCLFCIFRYQVRPIWTASVCRIISDHDQKDWMSKEHSIIRTPFLFLKITHEISTGPLCSLEGKDSIPLGQVRYIYTRLPSMCAYGVILILIYLLIWELNFPVTIYIAPFLVLRAFILIFISCQDFDDPFSG